MTKIVLGKEASKSPKLVPLSNNKIRCQKIYLNSDILHRFNADIKDNPLKTSLQ